MRIPIGHHKTGCRDGRNERIGTLVGLLDILIVEHHVCTHFQPLGRATIKIHTTRIAVEQRARSRTLLAVIAAREVVVGLFVGTRHREFVALQHRRRVIDLVEPIHVDLRQQVIVLTRGQADLLLVLDSLGGVHQIPIATRHLRDTQLSAELDRRAVVDLTALGGDHDHTICRTGAIDRGRRGVLQHRNRLNISRIDRIEIRRCNGHSIEDIERCRTRIDRVRTADGHHGRRAGLTRVRQHRQTRHLTLQRLVEGCRRGLFDLCGLDGRNRAGHSTLLSCTVGDHNHVVNHLCISR